MIRVKNPETNRDILIMWKHKIPQQPSEKKMDQRTYSKTKLKKEKETGSTTCFICDDNRESIIVYAEALQHPNDQFSRKIGRKISFERAINEAELSRKVRLLIWNAYLSKCNVL